MTASHEFEFWYEFASTCSSLSVMRIETAAAAAQLEVAWRPFLLGPIFRAKADANKAALRAQTERAQQLGTFGAPSFGVGDEIYWGNDRLADAIAKAVQF